MTNAKDFGFGADETLLRDQLRKWLDERAGIERLRALVAADPDAVYRRGTLPRYDEDAWRACVALGYAGLAVPEADGGAGVKTVAVVAVAEEVGRHAFPSPWLATLVATYVLRAACTDEARTWLGRIADGTTVSLAMTPADGDWSLDRTEVEARRERDTFVLSGTACFVQDAFKVDAFLVAARTGDGIGLFVVPKDADGVVRRRDHIVDLTRDQARLELRDVRIGAADAVAQAPGGLPALRRAWPAVLAVTSADLVGASEWLLATTVEYAKVRRQFDRSIGSFQAVKHPLVDAMMAIDRARSHVYAAAAACDADAGEAEIAARMAKSAASDAASFVAGRAVQLHGGIGFTWDCDVHLFFKRCHHGAALYGDGVHQRRALADLLIGPIPGERSLASHG